MMLLFNQKFKKKKIIVLATPRIKVEFIALRITVTNEWNYSDVLDLHQATTNKDVDLDASPYLHGRLSTFLPYSERYCVRPSDS